MSLKSGYDPNCPQELKTTQSWFASVITRPLDEKKNILLISPTGQTIDEEAKHFIKKSKKLQPHERIQIYNQQYWWRLLNILHTTFPLLIRLFGYYDFNQTIGIPYLLSFPPNHWSLNHLGDNMAVWIETSYQGNDKKLLFDAAKVDLAYNDLFITSTKKGLQKELLSNLEKTSDILEHPLILQPFVSLFDFNYHFFEFRDVMIVGGDGDDWLEKDFPEMRKEKHYYFALYRNNNLSISWKELSPAEHFLLSKFTKKTSIEKACNAIEKSPHRHEAEQQLQSWFQEWVERQWLALC